MNDLPKVDETSLVGVEATTVRRRPIGRPVVVNAGKAKPVVVKAKESIPAQEPSVKAPEPEVRAAALPALQRRPKFEECHNRRTIYLAHDLDSKVQQICKTHPVYRSMSLLIQAALSEFFEAKKL